MVIFTPACHGMASAVSAASPTCRECTHMRSCLRDAVSFVNGLPGDDFIAKRARREIAVTARALLGPPPPKVGEEGAPAPLARSRSALTPVEVALVAALPKRVASQVRTLLETGWFDYARRELAAGRCPADKGWRAVYCRQLLAGGATRESLRLALIEELQLSAASAKVQVSNAISIFAAGKLAVETAEGLQLTAAVDD